jgi:rhomboid family protein
LPVVALSAVWSRMARVWVTVTYAVILFSVSMTLSALGPTAAGRVFQYASTNLHNLNHGHLATLLDSAFVVDAGAPYLWLPGLICLMGAAELLWRSRRLVVGFAVGHIGATLLVAVGLATAVKQGWLPVSITVAEDVGMSYGATAVLGTLTGAVPGRWRAVWIGGWLAVGASVLWVTSDFTDVGHVVALLLGMAVATRFGKPGPWTWMRVALLAVGACFGFLILANTPQLLVAASVCGAAGALLGALVSWLWPAKRRACEAAPVETGQPALRG